MSVDVAKAQFPGALWLGVFWRKSSSHPKGCPFSHGQDLECCSGALPVGFNNLKFLQTLNVENSGLKNGPVQNTFGENLPQFLHFDRWGISLFPATYTRARFTNQVSSSRANDPLISAFIFLVQAHTVLCNALCSGTIPCSSALHVEIIFPETQLVTQVW